MKKIAIVALLSAFAAAPALADNTGKFYVAADLGKATYNNVTVGLGTYPDPGMFRFAGGYHYSPMLAAEVGYSTFGDSTLSTGTASATVTASSFQIAAVGTYPASPDLDIFAKLGLASNKHKIDATVASMSSSKNDLLVGIGAQYNVNTQVGVRVQYDHFGKFGDFGTTGKAMEASTISAGVVLNF